MGAIIPSNELKEIILTFHGERNCFVDVDIQTGTAGKTITMVTPHMLETYLIHNFNDVLKLKGEAQISDKQKRKIINNAVDFMRDTFGIQHISKTHKVMTARSTLFCFLLLKKN